MNLPLGNLQQQVLDALQRQQSLRIRGGGSKDFYGPQRRGEILDTRAYAGVVSYQPSELVITARSGTPLAEIAALLAEHGQMLAFEPPHFSPHATLGGCVAAGLSGPRRAAVGAVRDFVLGAKLLDGRGQILSFGGQVMKNVAGYDVARVLAGSMGSLGVLLEVSLKVLPIPTTSLSLQSECSQPQAIEQLNRWAGMPLPISASMWHQGMLTIRLEGSAPVVADARARLPGEALSGDAAQELWRSVREQTHQFFQSEQALWRLSVPATTPQLPSLTEALIEWRGALRWYATHHPPELMRNLANQVGGHATLFRRGAAIPSAITVFQALAPAIAAIQKRLRAAFDPQAIFNQEA